jgi:cellulose synthase/poly-beta-1,6-N-acetylglucosamine synthase-like glycosyltransferase
MFIELLLALVAALLAIPVTVLFAQVVLSLLPNRAFRGFSGSRPRVGVIVPAHNEALGIARTLAALRPQLTETDRLLVVADNCSDDTARIARDGGADVVERHDDTRRGKGYALDFGVRSFAQDPPDVVVIVDADCEVESGSIETIAMSSHSTGRPTQALYLMYAPSGAGLRIRIGAFAWLVKNQVRPLGMLRVGMPCPLMGTGMAFPWKLIESASLATGHIVEDLKMGIELAIAGTPALFCPRALVTSFFPSSAEGVRDQRVRWEHGHLGVIAQEAPPLLLRAARTGDVKLLALALDLTVPPLAFLTLLLVAVTCVNVLCSALGYGMAGTYIAAVALVELAIAVVLAWARYGRASVSLWDLARAPLYALQKIPIYLKFFVRRQAEWIRSKRDAP